MITDIDLVEIERRARAVTTIIDTMERGIDVDQLTDMQQLERACTEVLVERLPTKQLESLATLDQVALLRKLYRILFKRDISRRPSA
jgi:hypothetical protein